MLLEYEKQVNQLGGTLDNEEVKKEPANNKTAIENAEITKPNDAIIIESDETKGIVMKDSKDNEWVWIEVPGVEVFKTATSSTQYDKIKSDLISYVSDPFSYRDDKASDEWYAYSNEKEKYIKSTSEGITEEEKNLKNGCGLTYNEYEILYQNMLSSIYKNGGFWISRYEIGDENSTLNNLIRTRSSGILGNPVSKINQVPYNFVSCEQSQILAESMVTQENKKSSLLFGIQWDLVCKFLEINGDWDTTKNTAYYYLKDNSSSWGNSTKSKLKLYRGRYCLNESIIGFEPWVDYNIDTSGVVESCYLVGKGNSRSIMDYRCL